MIGWFFNHTRAECKASHMLGLLSPLSYILSSWCLLKTKLRNKQDEQEPCRLHFQKIVQEWNFEWWAFVWYSHWVCIWVSASEFGRFARLSYRLLDPVNNLRFATRCKEEPWMALGNYMKQWQEDQWWSFTRVCSEVTPPSILHLPPRVAFPLPFWCVLVLFSN